MRPCRPTFTCLFFKSTFTYCQYKSLRAETYRTVASNSRAVFESKAKTDIRTGKIDNTAFFNGRKKIIGYFCTTHYIMLLIVDKPK